jgi:hypothetical protein
MFPSVVFFSQQQELWRVERIGAFKSALLLLYFCCFTTAALLLLL